MNKSKIASQIAEDIYTFNYKYEKAKTKFNQHEINETKFNNALYILLCKVAYLTEVVDEIKEKGYKFARYEKEMLILEDLVDNISSTFKPQNVSKLSIQESTSLGTYLSKYENVVDVFDEFYEDLKESVKGEN